MVKSTVWNNGKYTSDYCENTKFTRELNTYGIGEELLFPIRLTGNQETNLATYLVKYKEFKKTSVKIKKVADKERFNQIFLKINLNFKLPRLRPEIMFTLTSNLCKDHWVFLCNILAFF